MARDRAGRKNPPIVNNKDGINCLSRNRLACRMLKLFSQILKKTATTGKKKNKKKLKKTTINSNKQT